MIELFTALCTADAATLVAFIALPSLALGLAAAAVVALVRVEGE